MRLLLLVVILILSSVILNYYNVLRINFLARYKSCQLCPLFGVVFDFPAFNICLTIVLLQLVFSLFQAQLNRLFDCHFLRIFIAAFEFDFVLYFLSFKSELDNSLIFLLSVLALSFLDVNESNENLLHGFLNVVVLFGALS